MATHSIPSLQTTDATQPEPTLTHDQWWELFDQLRLSQQADYAEYGGAVAFFRNERDADSNLA